MSTPAGREESRSSAFDQLHRLVQAVVVQVWRWTAFRPAQERAIPLVVEATDDVLIVAGTATGKTEAAFLPIVSNLLNEPPTGPGTQVLTISPLKALIDDQHDRLTRWVTDLDIPVHARHGGIAGSRKKRWFKNPSGILLTTPESLEALFTTQGTQIPRLLAELRYIVIDEVHAFIGTERGAQLASQLNRLDLALGYSPARIGLSATVGDPVLAAAQLRPDQPGSVKIINPGTSGKQLVIHLHGFLDPAVKGGHPSGSVIRQVCKHIFRLAVGHDNLVFANSRGRVEEVTDHLRDLATKAHVADTFHAHHGNLSQPLREEAEHALKDTSRPATVVATMTLELGLDVGSVAVVFQLGAPASVASMRQRVGRSGRRDDPAHLVAYCVEPEITVRSALSDRLRNGTAQTGAMIELMRAGWCEPPEPGDLHTSTLLQQVLSLIAQHGGVTPSRAFQTLCAASGPFAGTKADRFKRLLRTMGDAKLIEQHGNELHLGSKGEPIVNGQGFFAVFLTPEEFRVLSGGRTLGTKSMEGFLQVEDYLIWGGSRWKVTAIDYSRKVIELVPASGGKAPTFDGDSPHVHDVVRLRMRDLLASKRPPGYMDDTAKALLAEGSDTFTRMDLGHTSMLFVGKKTILLPWAGSRASHTLTLLLREQGVDCGLDRLTIDCAADRAQTEAALIAIVEGEVPDAVMLARGLAGKATNKYDEYLDNELLSEDYAARELKVPAALQAARRILRRDV